MGRNLFILILFCEFSLCDEFIFWAKLDSQNNFISSEILSVSKAMVLSSNKPSFVCEINASLGLQESKLEFLRHHKNELFECFVGAEILVKSSVFLDNLNIYSNTQTTIFPIRFDANFKENFVIISKFDKEF